ncbi:uncharacterized protein LOC108915889 [Anoplophora glabripennis]|uniref:uncharacterized protein LOC108915889 n=1 Tax=Anoplophora glabripennis TaxID=217634 RepID=UPI000C782708|nr:uncharacterized protein LOC108915889 [Anoplophora glabripennis]
MVGSAFVVVSNYSVKDYKKSMALAALGIQLCPNQRNDLMVNWIKAKVAQRNAQTDEGNEVQKVTLVSAFKRFKKEMEFLTDGANLLTVNDKIDLLVFELEQYKKRWKSKVPMMCALKELCDIADLNRTVEVIVNVFGDCDLMLHEEVPKILQTTLKKYEAKVNEKKISTPQDTLFTAVLYYMHYKYCVKDTITKNAVDMERTMSDPSEECDIVSFYDCLNLNRYFGVMKYLNKSLELLTSFTKVTPSMVYNLLVKISMEYRLHRFSVKSLQALQLALKVAQFENNASNVVWAIAFIIENSDVNKSYIRYLLLIANEQLKNIEYTSMPSLKIVLTYYICKAKCLLYEDYKQAYRIFQMADELYNAQEDKSELKIVESQLYLLHFKFVMMPCKFGIVDHKESTLLTIHLANSAIYEAYRNNKLDGSYEMSILLDTNEELVKLFHSMRSPREARSYCKETIILTQQLVLPIRCANYLVYLAHADLRSSRYNDCQVKIEGLTDILCLRKYNLKVDQENKPPSCDADIEKDIVDLTNNLQEMVLDLPVPNSYKKQFSPSSPALVIQPFHLPAFLNHEEDCECFYCLCLEYQMLVLEKTRLDALLNVKQNNFTISTDFFHGAQNFYELCSQKYKSTFETIVKFISYDLIPEYDKEMFGPYGFILLDYSAHLMRTKNKSEALRITDKLIDLASSRKVRYVYLYNEALFQKLSYITEVPSVALTVNKAIEVDSLCPEPIIVSRTPESKHSKVTLSVQQSPNFSPPKRRIKKCLQFNLSPTPDNFNGHKPLEKTSPSSKQPKTPVPKIKIYSNGDTAQKSKCSSSAVHIYNDESKRHKKKVPSTEDSCPSSINAAMKTPVSACLVNSETGMRTRTKLLTDRLRHSSKKLEVPTVFVSDDSSSQVKAPSGKKQMSLRKKLFDQEKLEKEPNVPLGGGAGRSTRNRKV